MRRKPKEKPSIEEQLKIARRESRKLKKYLKLLASCVNGLLYLLDLEMGKPPSVRRDNALGRIAGALEMANDSARRFGLGDKFPLKRGGDYGK